MTSEKHATLGLVGLGVMGRNLALNVESRGFPVAAWTRNEGARAAFASENAGRAFTVCASLAELAQSLERPRRVLIMVTAGAAVDAVIDDLVPLLEPGDVVIDGGNTWFEDTRRRAAALAGKGLRLVGVGVSGGEEGARLGPSLMPGGDAAAYELLRPVFEAIAARTDQGACVTHVGPGGAGHFVKMVHNGIEYADMQIIAEAYDLLRRGMGLEADALAALFTEWNAGPLESFLIEITGKIFAVRDERTGRPLVDLVLDQAGQKGTGRWTVRAALELGIPIPSIAAAVDARGISSFKRERVAAAVRLARRAEVLEPGAERLRAVHDALYAAKACAYAQGMHLIRAASDAYEWDVDLAEMGRIWRGGCIIRSRFLDLLRDAFRREPRTFNLLYDSQIGSLVAARLPALRDVLAWAGACHVPVPALAASLAYFEGLHAGELPQNLTQAQRDAFGAHTYVRKDTPGEGPQHTEWLG